LDFIKSITLLAHIIVSMMSMPLREADWLELMTQAYNIPHFIHKYLQYHLIDPINKSNRSIITKGYAVYNLQT
jgi:hypothetical protein